VLEEFDGNDAVVDGSFKLVVYDIACDDLEVGESLGFGNRVNVLLLRPGVGEGSDLRVGKYFGEVERC
jgi:hypothetical protein